MKSDNKHILQNTFSLNRYSKRSIAIITDILLCLISTWFAFFVRLEDYNLISNYNFNKAAIISLVAIPIFWVSGVYRTLFRHAGLSILFTITLSTIAYGVVYFSIITIYETKGVPRIIGILQPILFFLLIVASRFTAKFLLTGTFKQLGNIKNKENILIYGAGDIGRQLLISLENNPQYKVIGFLDDNPQLHRQILLGQKIYDPNKIENLKQNKNINLILFAIPSINRSKKNEIIKNLSNHQLVVKTLPYLNDIIDGKVSVSDIKDFLVDDLLFRDQIEPDQDLLNKNIKSKSVLVTGAGGTIGAELCRQIIRLKPKILILLEFNEFALYKIKDELISINKNLKIIPLLSNVQDQQKLEKIFQTFKVDTIYHTAAYKHVDLVEANICEGVKNNVFGTLAVAKASINQKVKNLVLISSDKAVRPTNIMGASKRFAELCMQGLHNMNKDIGTSFSIVRFGNVINSSGSAIPKFRKQIKYGGPVTLTHPDVTRYFMTVTEAAQLVIQAGAMSDNCEVFILDMGESIKIKNLINKMIVLSGLKVKDDKNLDGDIEINVTGLRPGEKLYEELLIGDNPEKTSHLKIQKIKEPHIPYDQLKIVLNDLAIFLNNNETNEVKKLLDKLVKLYTSNSKIVDHIYKEQIRNDNKKKSIHDNNQINNVVKIK